MAKGNKKFNAVELPVAEPSSSDKYRPIFCLEHVRSGFDLKNPKLTVEQRAAFAERLQEMASLTWEQLKRSGRHKQGFELLDVNKLKISMPSTFREVSKVWVFRYSGKLPMVGVRSDKTFHILAIERQYNDLYDHG